MDTIREISSINSPQALTKLVVVEQKTFLNGLPCGLTASTPVDPFFEVASNTLTLNSQTFLLDRI